MPKPRKSNSIRTAAGKIRKSHATVIAWMAREDWPFGQPPWDDETVLAIAAWARKFGRPKSPPEFVQARTIRMVRDCQLLATQNAIARGELISSREWQEACSTAISAAKLELAKLGAAIARRVTAARAAAAKDEVTIDYAGIVALEVDRMQAAYTHAINAYRPGATNERRNTLEGPHKARTGKGRAKPDRARKARRKPSARRRSRG